MTRTTPHVALDLSAAPELFASSDIRKTLRDVTEEQLFDYVVFPLFPRRDVHAADIEREKLVAPASRSDLCLNADEWNNFFVGVVAPNLRLDDANSLVRRNSEKLLMQEAAWAGHLALTAMILPMPPADLPVVNYARFVRQLSDSVSSLQLWVTLPLQWSSAEQASAVVPSPWHAWNTIRVTCDYPPALKLALVLTEDMPSDDVLDAWIAEPVKSLIVPTSVFSTNTRGHPVLSRAHHAFVQRLMDFKVEFIVQASPSQATEDLSAYRKYIRFLHEHLTPLSDQAMFEAPYWDYMQVPLQPLMDNLESRTYETFERDPVKYVQYQKAVELALIDKDLPRACVMVVGAGRGPLVRASLAAAEAVKKDIVVYAVEKNPNAVFTLRDLHERENWGDRVTIISADMRDWVPTEKADILVSELLGSFSDNELSPECLDGALRLMKDDGVSIPCSYTSFLAPVQAHGMHTNIKSYDGLKHWETVYVVKLHAFRQLAESQACFEFVHPNRAHPIDNTRYAALRFQVPNDSTVHGFAGYFESVLYKDVIISTNPQTESVGMFSWFPAYFPIDTPLAMRAGDHVTVHFWRLDGKGRVWYEWSVSEPSASRIHNPQGRSYFIGLA